MEFEFIKDYSYGRITIGGRTYNNDLILLGKNIESDWWRDEGHMLQKQDLEKVIDYQPDLLIIGTGTNGNMIVPEKLSENLEFKVKSYLTKNAVKEYNKEIENSKKVAAAFHLTC
ncbi:MAG: hypothetical protein GF317_19560 [Candidatus Lokiarchaeota archaeon]|nr:hypothetical protein [Candidatus Lokiarchaeota archaeon]MBD3201694.1 hypothetical protein [Candidatus Lokiarchaeota archaeon]